MKTKLSPIEKQFWKAIENRDLKAFKKALAAGADVSKIRSADGENLLRCGMERRADDIALYLLESNEAVDPKDASLIWAVLVRRPDTSAL